MKQLLCTASCLAMLFCGGCAGKESNALDGDETHQAAKPMVGEVTLQATPELRGGKEKDVRESPSPSLAELRRKYAHVFVIRGPRTKRQVALTFDDGPDLHFTPQVLDMLKKHRVKATFFLVGKRAQFHPEIVKRIVAEGHVIGNHSYYHANLPKLNHKHFRDEILRTESMLKKLTGYAPKLVRPPYGTINEKQIKWLARKQYTVVNWNVDSLDWKGLIANEVTANVLGSVSPGAIILQHSAGGTGEDLSGSVQALDTIIQTLKRDRVRLVTLPELLNISKAMPSPN
ncbi:polysaccharide deacetylase family protein [Laceyella putida]|uniref:Polysaccharide deacetylase family protein n=1 Tax=Laceyella putida TaxID=110101 RepID=A0ABW2RKW8_9BACL